MQIPSEGTAGEYTGLITIFSFHWQSIMFCHLSCQLSRSWVHCMEVQWNLQTCYSHPRWLLNMLKAQHLDMCARTLIFTVPLATRVMVSKGIFEKCHFWLSKIKGCNDFRSFSFHEEMAWANWFYEPDVWGRLSRWCMPWVLVLPWCVLKERRSSALLLSQNPVKRILHPLTRIC